MKKAKGKKMFQRNCMIILAVFGFCSGGYLLIPAAAGTAEPGVACRVEIDRHVLPANGPRKAVVKVTLDAPPLPERIERPARPRVR